jgi:hypothetical protein
VYIGRFPLFGAVALIVIGVLLVCFVLQGALRSRLRNEVLRGAALCLFVVPLLLSPMLVYALTHDARMRPPAVLYWLPAATTLVLVITAALLFPRTKSNVLMWRTAYFAISWTFLALNLANWCNPGWCEHYGFPFPYSWWSDAVMTMNGETQTAGFSAVAIVANVACMATVAAAMSLRFRRR